MFPSDCVLERRVRSDGDQGLAATNLPFFILKCNDRKADGYAEDKLDIYNNRLQDMNIGVRLASKPPAVSHLTILGAQAQVSAEIAAVDKTVIVIIVEFTCEGAGPRSYLIYDAVALSLRMIPMPEDPFGPGQHIDYIVSSSVSLARPCGGPDYALVHMGRLDAAGAEDSLFLWRPSSSSPSPPWSEYRKAALPYWSVNEVNTEFSFNGHAYWVDLLCGGFCFSCDAIFDDNSSVLKYGGFIPLPVEPRGYDERSAEPAAYRTMGVVRDSFIRFVSIDGFQEYVKLKHRTMTVWKLLGHDEGWEKEHELSLETLWGFEGFGDDVPKELTPMYPLLSTNDADIVYLGLGEYRETKIVRASLPPEREFFPHYPRYMLELDMRNKIVRTSLPLEGNKFSRLVSCSFIPCLRQALVGPCDDEGVPIHMKKKGHLEKPICC